MRIVIDSNIFVSAFVYGGILKQKLIRVLQNRRIKIIVSQQIVTEMKTVLMREKFTSQRSPDQLKIQLEAFLKTAEMIRIYMHVDDCRDAKDNLFLDCAVCGQADFIITGDQDLLALDPYRNIRIMRISDFIAYLNTQKQ